MITKEAPQKGIPKWERMEPPRCSVCDRPIVGCLGKHGDWKHLRSNKERGDDGHLAFPRCTL